MTFIRLHIVVTSCDICLSLTSLSIISSNANGIISFFLWLHLIFFIWSSVDGHLGCFHVLAVVNSAAMNSGVHVSFQVTVFSGYMPRSGIAGSYGISVFSF